MVGVDVGGTRTALLSAPAPFLRASTTPSNLARSISGAPGIAPEHFGPKETPRVRQAELDVAELGQ